MTVRDTGDEPASAGTGPGKTAGGGQMGDRGRGRGKGALASGMASGSIGMIARASSQIGTLLVTLVSTQRLAISEFGAFAIASSLMALSRNTFYVGSYEYMLKSQQSDSLFGSCLVTNVVLALFSYACLTVFALASPSLFETTLVESLILWLSPSVFIAMVTAWFEALMLRRGLVRQYYSVMLLAEASGALAAIGLLMANVGVFSLLAQIYVRLLLMLFLYMRWRLPDRWRHFQMTEVRYIIGWSWSRYGSVLLNFATAYGADLVLGALISPAASGLYRASNRIVSALSDLFAQPIQKISLAAISARTARGLQPDQQWLTIFAGIAPVAWTLLAGLACFASTLVPAVLGEKWTAAAPIVAVFCAARALTILDATTASLLVCFSQQRFMLAVQATTAVMALAATALLAPIGPFGVAFGTAVVMWTGSIAYAHRAARLTGLSAGAMAGTMARSIAPALAAVAGVVALRLVGPNLGHLGHIDLDLGAQMATGTAIGLVALIPLTPQILAAFRTVGARPDRTD